MLGKKEGKNVEELSLLVSSHPVQKAIVFAINAPKLLSHIYIYGSKATKLNQGLFRHHIRQLTNRGIIKYLTPKLKFKEAGKVYDLTEKGLKVKKIICAKENKICLYKRLKNIDWYKYGKIVLGSQKIALLKVLDNKEPQRISKLVRIIRDRLHYKTQPQRARNYPNDKAWGMVRQNVNNTLQWLVRRGLVVAEKFPRKKKRQIPITKYRLSEEGETIKRQMLESFKL